MCFLVPEGVSQPVVFYVDDIGGIVNVSWVPPLRPNGIILYYVLYSGDSVLYNGTGLLYQATQLDLNLDYRFSVEAFNSAGSTRSRDAYLRRFGKYMKEPNS